MSKALSTDAYETTSSDYYHKNEAPHLRNFCSEKGNFNSFSLHTGVYNIVYCRGSKRLYLEPPLLKCFTNFTPPSPE
jgi:hypothetical protein